VIAVQDPRSVVEKDSLLIEREWPLDELELVREELGQPDRLAVRRRVFDEEDPFPYIRDDVPFLADVRLRG